MKLTPKPTFSEDIQDARSAIERPRVQLFGLKFGTRNNVDDVRLSTFANGMGLVAEVRVNGQWKRAPDSLFDRIATRHVERAASPALPRAMSAPKPTAPAFKIARKAVPALLAPLHLEEDAGAFASELNAQLASVGRAGKSELSAASALQREFYAPSYKSGYTQGWSDSLRTSDFSASSFFSARSASTAATSAPSTSSSTWEAYCDELAKSTTFAGNTELLALANVLGRPLVVATRTAQSGSPGAPPTWSLATIEPSHPVSPAPFHLLLERSDDAIDSGHYSPLRVGGLSQKDLSDDLYDVAEKVPGDGSCLFHSLKKLNATSSATQLRAETVSWLRQNGETLIGGKSLSSLTLVADES